jgi:hypothetical protein
MALLPAKIPSQRLDVILVSLNILLSTATVAMVCLIALRWKSNLSTTILAGALAMFWPNQLNYARLILSEVPCGFFAVSAILCYSLRKPLLCGLFAGVASAFRNSLLPLPILLLLTLMLKKEIRSAMLAMLGIMAVLAATATQTYSRTGSFATTGADVRLNFITANNSMGEDAKIFYGQISTEDAAKVYFSGIIEHPSYFLRQRAAAFWVLWGPWPGKGAGRSTFSRLLIGLRFLLLIVAVIGFLSSHQTVMDYLLAAPPITVTVVHTMSLGDPRYTYPAEPFLIILAAGYLAHRLTKDTAKTSLRPEGLLASDR